MQPGCAPPPRQSLPAFNPLCHPCPVDRARLHYHGRPRGRAWTL